MKTPREVLLNRHKSVQTKLDQVRERVLDHELRGAEANVPGFRSLLAFVVSKLWNELVWPSRRTWAGLASVWVVLLAVNLSGSNDRETARATPIAESPETLAVLRQQREMLAEFVQVHSLEPADSPRRLPRPRSENAVPWMIG